MEFLRANSFYIIMLLIVVGVMIFNAYSRRPQKDVHKCPKCESTDVLEIGQETKDSSTLIQGNQIGADVRLQLDLDLRLRCKKCGNNFHKRVKRSY